MHVVRFVSVVKSVITIKDMKDAARYCHNRGPSLVSVVEIRTRLRLHKRLLKVFGHMRTTSGPYVSIRAVRVT